MDVSSLKTIETHTSHHSFSGRVLGASYDLVEAMLLVKVACARANFETSALSEKAAAEIERACLSLLDDPKPELFPVDLHQGGGGIAINTNINEVLEVIADGVSHRDCNVSQSTSDVVATALRLQLLRRWSLFEKTLTELQTTLLKKSDEFSQITVIGRTCLRDALPTALGNRFRGFAKSLERSIDQIEQEFSMLFQVRLGGTVLGGGEGASQAYRNVVVSKLAELTDMSFQSRDDLYDASQNIDDLGRVAHALALLSQTLIKFCKDLRLMNSGPEHGFNEIEFPKVVKGSSFFKEKNNPTVVETVIQACFRALGSMKVVDLCVEHGELDLNTFEIQAAAQIAETISEMNLVLLHFEKSALRELKPARKNF